MPSTAFQKYGGMEPDLSSGLRRSPIVFCPVLHLDFIKEKKLTGQPSPTSCMQWKLK